MLGVAVTDLVEDQHLDGGSNQLLPRITENGCDLRVDQQDSTACVDTDHGIGRRLEQRGEASVGVLLIAQRTRDRCDADNLSAAIADWGHRHHNVDGAPVGSKSHATVTAFGHSGCDPCVAQALLYEPFSRNRDLDALTKHLLGCVAVYVGSSIVPGSHDAGDGLCDDRV